MNEKILNQQAFISYSFKDESFAAKLAERLSADGIKVWFAEWAMKAGDSIVQKISAGITDSSFFIVIISPNSRASDWVTRELDTALMRQLNKRDIIIIPLLLDCNADALPPLLSGIYALKFDSQTFDEQQYKKISTTIIEKQRVDTLRQHEEVFFAVADLLDAIIKRNKPTRSDIEFVLEHLQQEHYRNYFFRKAKATDWFSILKQQGYFTPDDSFMPQNVGDGKYIVPWWNVLPYLESVAKQSAQSGDKKLTDEILQLIRDISSYNNKNGLPLDNYNIWTAFVAILLVLPNDCIPIDVLDLFPIWLTSEFPLLPQGADIATKLLPKFLPDSPTEQDINKAENILDHLTAYRWKDRPEEKDNVGLLLSMRTTEAETIVETYWLLESFVNQKNARKIGLWGSEKPIYLIASKLRHVLGDKRLGWYDIETKPRIYRLEATLTANNEINLQIGVLDRSKLASEDQTQEFLITLKSTPTALLSSVIPTLERAEFIRLAKIALQSLPELNEIERSIDDGLNRLYGNLFSDYSYIWAKDINAISISGSEKAKEIFTVILREMLLGKAERDKSTTLKLFETLLAPEYGYSVFNRLFLHVISNNWEQYIDSFANLISNSDVEQWFDDESYKNELYQLIKTNCDRFSSSINARLLEIINRGPQRYLPATNQEQYIHYWKQKWFSAARAIPQFEKLYLAEQKVTKIPDSEIEEVAQPRAADVRWTIIGTPERKTEILAMSNTRIVKEFLSSITVTDNMGTPQAGNLAEFLRMGAQENPEKFFSDLDPFLFSGYLCIFEVIAGLKDAWNNKKFIDWSKMFPFITKIVKSSEFWENKMPQINYQPWDADHKWVVGTLGELIEAGSKDDNWAFDPEYISQAVEIVQLIMNKLEVHQPKDTLDPVTYSLNSPWGKIISGLIQLSQRVARLNQKQLSDLHWWSSIKIEYDGVLRRGVTEAFTLLGLYLPYLAAIDRPWLEEKVTEIKAILGDDKWTAFMSGYLFHGTLYGTFFSLMTPHYLFAVKHPFKETDTDKRLINHLTIAYLEGHDTISDSELFGALMKQWLIPRIQAILDLLWLQRPYFTNQMGKYGSRIVDFTRLFFNHYNNVDHTLTLEERKLFSNACKLIIYVPKIDKEMFEWFKKCFPFAPVDYNVPYLIEALDTLKGTQDKETLSHVGELLIILLNSSIPPVRAEKHIRSIVEYFYQNNLRDLANQICNISFSKWNDETLRDLYASFN